MPEKRSPQTQPGRSKAPNRSTTVDVLRSNALVDDSDDDVIRFLYGVQCATTDQISRAVLNRTGEDHDEVGRRLSRLAELKMVVNRRVRPFALAGLGEVRQVWTVEEMGLTRALHYRVPMTERLSVGSFRRHVATAEFAARLLEAGTVEEWIREPLRWTHGDGYRHGMVPRPIFLEPDRKVLLPRGRRTDGRFRRTGWATIYIEIDMGTESDRQIEWKLDRYRLALDLSRNCWTEAEARVRFMAAAWVHRYVLFACYDSSRVQAIQDMMDDHQLPGIALPYFDALTAISRIEEVATNNEKTGL